jgi:hypothetical protein
MIRLFLLILLLAGCGTYHHARYQPEALRYYPLLLPNSYGRAIVIEQLLDGWAKGEHFRLHSQLEIDAHHILVMGFTTFQIKAFALRYDGQTLAFENFTDREMPFPPAMILSDIQKIFWPTLPHREGWNIVDDTQGKVRLVFFAGQLVTRIQYQGTSPIDGDVELIDLQYGYQLHIHILNVTSPDIN